jgi:hypothetical protein
MTKSLLTEELKTKQQYCKGCRDDFYNESGNSDTGCCWSLPNAEVVTRYRLHWWTQPTVPGAFTKVTTLTCHYEPGQFAFYKELPHFAVGVR